MPWYKRANVRKSDLVGFYDFVEAPQAKDVRRALAACESP